MTYVVLFFLSITAWIIDAILQFFLYYTSNPLGLQYMAFPDTMYKLGLFYSAAFVLGFSLPCFIASCFLRKRPANPDGFSWKSRESILFFIHAFILCIFVAVNHADHELLRFYGTHYTFQMMSDYNLSSSTANFVMETLGNDSRGPYSALLLLGFPFGWLALMLIFRRRIQRVAERLKEKLPPLAERIVFFVALATTVILPISGFGAFVKNDIRKGWTVLASSRQLRTAPLPVKLIHDLVETRQNRLDSTIRFQNIDEKARKIQEKWLSEEPDKNWQFTGTDMPLHKTYQGTCPAAFGNSKPNVVLIFVESFRAWNLPDFNDKVKEDPMPFFHSLVSGESELMRANNLKSAYFTRYIASGHPTIDATISAHMGIPPHSSMTVASSFTYKPIASYSSYLRKHGYYTTFVNSSDGGFDSWSAWTKKWYDQTFDPLTHDDNVTLKLVSDVVIERRKHPEPYMVSGLTITNHIPFDVPAGGEAAPEGTPFNERIFYTLRYTDNALKGLFERLNEAHALSNTLFIIVGDHAYELGEIEPNEKGDIGSDSMRANANWIPLLMVSDFEQMPVGRHDVISSHADIPPTILEAAGICDDNSFFGHSLMKPAQHSAMECKNGHFTYRTNHYAGIFNFEAKPLLFDVDDVRQENELSASKQDVLKQIQDEGEMLRAVIDYGFEKDKFDQI